MPGIDGQLELFTEVSVGGKKVVIFVKVLYAEDNHGNLGSLGNVLYFASGVLQNTKSFGK